VKRVLIGNAGGYWGDDPHALRRQVLGGLPLDYISIDYLAEVTMSILQKQKSRDPQAGYARDFVTQITPLLETILARRIRIALEHQVGNAANLRAQYVLRDLPSIDAASRPGRQALSGGVLADSGAGRDAAI